MTTSWRCAPGFVDAEMTKRLKFERKLEASEE
jgi:hypothetical protein